MVQTAGDVAPSDSTNEELERRRKMHVSCTSETVTHEESFPIMKQDMGRLCF